MKKPLIIIFSVFLLAACASNKNGPVGFKTIDLEKEIPLTEGSKDSVHYHIKFHFTELTDYYDNEILEKVKTELNKQFFNAEKLEFSSSPDENFRMLIEAITPAYREEGMEIIKEMGEMGSLLNYELNKSSKIIYNQNNMLSFEIETYVYTGGAHGSSDMKYLHFDMKNGEVYGIDQAFAADKLQILSDLLEEKGEEIKKSEEMTLFEDAKVEMVDNFYFDDKNFYFVYNPYEIGPFSSGYITIELPLDDIKPLLLSEGPLGFMASN